MSYLSSGLPANLQRHLERKHPEPIELFRINVPTVRNDGRPFRTRYHRVWDAKVREITGGLTVHAPVIGQWEDKEEEGKLYKERMIPVEIACTTSDFLKILTMSKTYYDQIKMYGFKISSRVWVI